jgi:amidase
MSTGPELPSVKAILRIAEDYGIDLTTEDAAVYRDMMQPLVASYRRLEELPERKLPVEYPRTSGWRPMPEDNPCNGWYWRCVVEGAASGPLKGEKVALKDVVCLAGVPMMNGSQLLEGYVPDIDATIVTRLLDAGAIIIGKTNSEDCSFSGGGHTCSHGPVGNPRMPTHNPGASSNGSAVVLGTGQVDLAIGGDQGGSIRIPAAWSGVYGLKPTYACITSRSAPTPPYGQKPGTHRVAAGSMGRLDDIDGVIGPHQRAGRFNEFHCAVVSLATTIARTVGM